jgi:mannose-1-phosphate guanylyltransferase
MIERLWTVVLAAGAGTRLSSVTGGVPKQFWRGSGSPSLLDQTFDRFTPLAPGSRTVAVVDARHRAHVVAHARCASVDVVYQPEDRGTAAGVLLALMPVLEHSPDDVVVLTPSDHGFVDETGFRRGIAAAVQQARRTGDIVLFGAEPASPEPDYGWISTRRTGGTGGFSAVEGFVEKPPADDARRLFASGAVWNTMVIVARASALRDLYAAVLPELAAIFGVALGLPAHRRAEYLAGIYLSLPRWDFSRDVLGRAPRLSVYVWPAAMGWTDLGTPDRLLAWHQRHGHVAEVPEVVGAGRNGGRHADFKAIHEHDVHAAC